MAPQRTRGVPEDSKFDGSSTREKPAAAALLSGSGKGRRAASSAIVASSNLKDVTIAHATVEEPVGQQSGSDTTGGVRRLHSSLLKSVRQRPRLILREV